MLIVSVRTERRQEGEYIILPISIGTERTHKEKFCYLFQWELKEHEKENILLPISVGTETTREGKYYLFHDLQKKY